MTTADATERLTDWLGNDYGPGDLVLYAAMSGRCVTMILGRVVEIRDNGNVKIQPLKSSRWKQHSARSYYVDTRTGKHIEPWASSGKHIKEHGHYRDRHTHELLHDAGQGRAYGYYTEAGRKVDYGDYEYIPTQFQPWVEARTEDAPRPVTISITANIVKWNSP